MPADNKPRYFAALTGLRALLAWDVFLFHYGDAHALVFQNFIAGGGEVGVSMFFVLSGFLIAYQYSDKNIFTRENLSRYFFRRWSRIYPLFFFISACSILLLYLRQHDDPTLTTVNILLHFTLLKGFFQERIFLFIGPAWSLSAEECFYAVAPILFLLRKRISLLLQCLLILGLGFLITFIAQSCRSTDLMHQYNFMLYWTFFGRAFQFISGIWLALYIRKRRISPRSSPWFTIAGVIAIIAAQLSFPALHKITVWGQADVLAITFNNVVLPMLAVLLFYGLITERSSLKRLLDTRFFQLLGKSSFAFYLLHLSPIIKMPYRDYSLSSWLVFGLVQVLSILLYLFLEHPLHRFLNKCWEARRSAFKNA